MLRVSVAVALALALAAPALASDAPSLTPAQRGQMAREFVLKWGNYVERVEGLPMRPWALRLANVPVAYATYLLKMIWPVDLAPLYPYPETVPVLASFGAVALLVAITAAVVRERIRRPVLLVGWLWFLGTLVPVVGLVQVGAQPYADRYTYVPLTGLFLMIVWALADEAGRRAARIASGMCAVLVVAFLATLAAGEYREQAPP